MKALNAGELRHRIQFQTAVDAQNSFGEPVPTWTTAATMWAKIEPLSGRDLELMRTMGGTESHKITCRANPDIPIVCDGTTRILYGSRIFTMNSANDVEERGYMLQIMATEDVRK